MKNKYTGLAVSLALAVTLIALVAFSLLLATSPTQAAPPAAPTPVAAPDTTGKGVVIPLQAATALAADTNTTPVEMLNFKTIDVEFTIDQGTSVNTVTLTTQYSIGGTAWEDGAVLVTDNAADASDLIVRIPIFAKDFRVNQNVTNTNPVTISITSVARP